MNDDVIQVHYLPTKEVEDEQKKHRVEKTLASFVHLCLAATVEVEGNISKLLLNKPCEHFTKLILTDILCLLSKILPKVFSTWKKIQNGKVSRMFKQLRPEMVTWFNDVITKYSGCNIESLDIQLIVDEVVELLLQHITRLQKNLDKIILRFMRNSLPDDYFHETRDEVSLRLYMYLTTPSKMGKIISMLEQYMQGAIFEILEKSSSSPDVLQHYYIKSYTEKWTSKNLSKVIDILSMVIKESGYEAS